MMEISKIKQIGTWRDVADSARTTVGKGKGTGDPPDSWKKQLLLAEHSPIRKIKFSWKWKNLPSWVSVHFVRHNVGISHFVETQRTDRTGIDRNSLTQDSPVTHECEANVQALINISRKRLCSCASPETRQAWKMVVDEIRKIDPIIASVMVSECLYRGFCPETKDCGFVDSVKFWEDLKRYKFFH
jgi:hypothetical protein